METQTELEKEVGTIEPEVQTLKAAKVKIVNVEVIEVGDKKNKKVNCLVMHPDKDEPITISSVSYLRDKAVVTTGLWYNLDKDENIQKGFALATFLSSMDSKNVGELKDKEVDTELDGKYLCFKAY